MTSLKKILILYFSFNLFFCCNFIQSNNPNCSFSDNEIFQIIYSNDLLRFNQWIQSNPNVNIYDSNKQTPLMIAAQTQNFVFAKQLLNAGANKHCVDIFGKTAKDYALQSEGYDSYNSHDCHTKDNFLTELGKDIAGNVINVLVTETILYLLCCAFNFKYDHFNYFNHTSINHANNYNYCIKCNSCFCFTYDPKSLYCTQCYKHYCFLKNYYH